ncbi:hypothetical protein KFE25_012435 [Diacronema lutheri]|uniref:C2 domain-containing protein n=1 Tax=Diacronema lutheri TaxID=2081491 RepID=A0A8J5XIV5_DIALT|nr:hypothetical protein KFE25_012435 [Diacronema lutheri]
MAALPGAVCVLEASGLPEADLGIAGDHSDPFVRMSVAGRTFESPVANDSLDPRWSWCVELEPPGADIGEQSFRFEVLDFDRYSGHDLLGSAHATMRLDASADRWLSLTPAGGRIRVTVRAPTIVRSPPSPPPPPIPPAAPPSLPPPSAPPFSRPLSPPAMLAVEHERDDGEGAAAPWPPVAGARAGAAWPAAHEAATWAGGGGVMTDGPPMGAVLAPAGAGPAMGAISVGAAGLVVLAAAALVYIGRQWGRGGIRPLRRQATRLLNLDAPRADTAGGTVELVQVVALSHDVPDSPPRYSEPTGK